MKRISYKDVSPAGYRALSSLEAFVQRSSIERMLAHLVYLRVSQINRCAFCIDMHTKDLIAGGESVERLALVGVFREAPSFTPRERTALAWAEAVTELGRDGVAEPLYQQALAEFGESGLVDLTITVGMINVWNRLSIAFGSEPGHYRPGQH